MDVDEPEAPAGRRRETDKQRREKGEAAYNPNADSDEPATKKRKAGPSKGGQRKKTKSVAIIADSEEDVPIIVEDNTMAGAKTAAAKGAKTLSAREAKAAAAKEAKEAKAKEAKEAKAAAAEAKAAVAKEKAEAAEARAVAAKAKAAAAKAAAEAVGTKAAEGKKAAESKKVSAVGTKAVEVVTKVIDDKLRSNFRRHLAPEIVKELDKMLGAGKISEDQAQAYVKWTKALPNKYRPIKGLRDNTPRAVVLLGETLTPPSGLTHAERTCDWCLEFAPMRCLVLDQGTSCLMCNFFRKKACTIDGVHVSPFHLQYSIQ